MLDEFLDALDDGKEYENVMKIHHQPALLRKILLEYIYAVRTCSSDEVKEEIIDTVRENLQAEKVFG